MSNKTFVNKKTLVDKRTFASSQFLVLGCAVGLVATLSGCSKGESSINCREIFAGHPLLFQQAALRGANSGPNSGAEGQSAAALNASNKSTGSQPTALKTSESADPQTASLTTSDANPLKGYSQSAVLTSLHMHGLAQLLSTPPDQRLSFVLVGNQNNPNGGLLSRFPNVSIPILGLDFHPPTPEHPTKIYSFEYDGFADFPRYPLNVLADVNNFIGEHFPQFPDGNFPGPK